MTRFKELNLNIVVLSTKIQSPAKHAIFFLGAAAFLSGIVYGSINLPAELVLIFALSVLAALFVLDVNLGISFITALFLMAGFVYFRYDDSKYKALVLNLPKTAEFSGVISDDPGVTADKHSFYFLTETGKFSVQTDLKQKFSYGDVLQIRGTIRRPSGDSYGKYLAKEHVVGTLSNPIVTKIGTEHGNRMMSLLFRIKHFVRDGYKKLLPSEQAAFLEGTTLGLEDDFSPGMLHAFSLSGTRHLTAISGANFTIIIVACSKAFSYVFSRRWTFVLTFFFVACFVALTGLAPSAIRAAVMGFAAAVAKQAERKYSIHNSILLSAVVLALWNPKVPVFDVGFQLSFLATLGIVYLEPILRSPLHFFAGDGFLGWKDSLFVTISAQAATAPILINQFQNFTLTSFAANIFVLAVIPLITVVGLIIALMLFVSFPLAHVLGALISPFIVYALTEINFFARIAVPFNPAMGLIGAAIYYTILVFLTFRFYKPRFTIN